MEKMEQIEKVERLKLSELSDDVEISFTDSSTVYTVSELKREILELGEPHHLTDDWHTIIHQRWSPDAKAMIDSYIESEYDNMYEDWDERANDCVTDEVIGKIQAILDEAFTDDYATSYWTFDKPIDIDIFPKGHCPKCGNEYINKDFGMCESCCEKHFEKLG